MPLPPAFLEELRARIPLSEVVGRRVPVTRAGREFKGCCPFHNEKTPSFYVNDQKGFFHCFGCGAHGDIIGFVMRYDRVGFPEAIEQLAAQAGMEVPRLTREEVEKAREQKTLHQLCEASCVWFEQQLQTARGRAALDYLRGRGLGDEAMARFRLGYAPGEGGALITHLKTLGYDLGQMLEVGLVRHNEERGEHYAFFRDRVMFPVTDRRGRVVAFGGRIMSGEASSSGAAGQNNKGPKYINSPDHPLFHKGKLLYSLARAREAAPRGATAVVVEGYMDVIAMVEAGFAAAVAPLGTALTESQIEELWKLGGTGGDPILCFDGDVAGQRAAARAVERILPLIGPERTARIAFLPDGQDPDDLIKAQGSKAMQAVLDQAIPLIDMLWRLETEGRNLSTPEARAGLKEALGRRVEQIADKNVQAFYRTALAERIYQAFAPGRNREKWQNQRFVGNSAHRDPAISRHLPGDPEVQRQRLVVMAILRHPDLFEMVGEQLVALELRGPLDKVWQAVVTTLETSPGMDSAGLRSHLCAQGFADTIDQLLTERQSKISKWAREQASVAEVEAGLRGIIAVGRLVSLQAEMKALGAREMDETTLARLSALRREMTEAMAAALPGDEETGI